MKPAVWSIIGLLIDIVGVFLLSVEAIKLDNLARLRDRVVVGVRTSFESPKLYFPDEHDESGRSKDDIDWAVNRRRGFNGNTVLYLLFHLIAPTCLILGLDMLRRRLSLGNDEWFWVLWWQWGSDWKGIVLLAFLLVFFLVLPFTVGCWGHKLIVNAANGGIWLLRVIESRTPTGGVGIVGFALIATGLIFQLIGVVLTM